MPRVLAGVKELDRGSAPRFNLVGYEQHRDELLFHVPTTTRSMHAVHSFPRGIIGEEPTRPQAMGEPHVTRWRGPQK